MHHIDSLPLPIFIAWAHFALCHTFWYPYRIHPLPSILHTFYLSCHPFCFSPPYYLLLCFSLYRACRLFWTCPKAVSPHPQHLLSCCAFSLMGRTALFTPHLITQLLNTSHLFIFSPPVSALLLPIPYSCSYRPGAQTNCT